MKMIKVRGSQEVVPELEVNVDTVYFRSNITAIDDDGFNGWEYDEIQYKKDEYIELISKKNTQLETDQLALSDAVADMIMGGM